MNSQQQKQFEQNLKSADTLDRVIDLAVVATNSCPLRPSQDDIQRHLDIVDAALMKMRVMTGLADEYEKRLALTRLLDEHPEGYEGDCECTTCLDAGS